MALTNDFLAGDLPRQLGEALEVRHRHAILGIGGAHATEPLQLAVGHLGGLLREVGLLQFLLQVLERVLRVTGASLAELVFDSLQLLP